jgi:hypothetical protein
VKESRKPIYSVVAAQPGYVTVYEQDTEYDLGEDVIAWHLETIEIETPNGTRLQTHTTPIVPGGTAPDNCVGVQQPNGQVVIFESATYSSLAEANKSFVRI